MFDKTCTNHPERAAIENCEVCGAPLCAYCLYYTNDGQRLCKQHADEAEAAGAFIRSPGVYSGGLIGAQVGNFMSNVQVIQLTMQVPGIAATAAPYQPPTDTPTPIQPKPTVSPSPTSSLGR